MILVLILILIFCIESVISTRHSHLLHSQLMTLENLKNWEIILIKARKYFVQAKYDFYQGFEILRFCFRFLSFSITLYQCISTPIAFHHSKRSVSTKSADSELAMNSNYNPWHSCSEPSEPQRRKWWSNISNASDNWLIFKERRRGARRWWRGCRAPCLGGPTLFQMPPHYRGKLKNMVSKLSYIS